MSIFEYHSGTVCVGEIPVMRDVLKTPRFSKLQSSIGKSLMSRNKLILNHFEMNYLYFIYWSMKLYNFMSCLNVFSIVLRYCKHFILRFQNDCLNCFEMSACLQGHFFNIPYVVFSAGFLRNCLSFSRFSRKPPALLRKIPTKDWFHFSE